jgi:hypothetical protein
MEKLLSDRANKELRDYCYRVALCPVTYFTAFA